MIYLDVQIVNLKIIFHNKYYIFNQKSNISEGMAVSGAQNTSGDID